MPICACLFVNIIGCSKSFELGGSTAIVPSHSAIKSINMEIIRVYFLTELKLNKTSFVLRDRWPTEAELVSSLGKGVVMDTKYGYLREYGSFSCCKVVRFYFESDDILCRPVSKIDLIGVDVGRAISSHNSDIFDFYLALNTRNPRSVLHENGHVIYDLFDQRVEIGDDSYRVTAYYE